MINGDARKCSVFHNAFEKNLNILKYCKSDSFANGCTGDIMGIDKVKTDPKASYNISRMNMLYEASLKGRQAFLTNSGISLIYYQRASRSIYLIDTNGLKGPNRYGYDLFVLFYAEDSNRLRCLSNLDGFYEPGGKKCSDMMPDAK